MFQIALELITEIRGVFTGQQAHSISPDNSSILNLQEMS
jgi:hypothetical protein